MNIYHIAGKKKRKRKSHVGAMEGAYHGKDCGKIDTRLTPVHRIKNYEFAVTELSTIVKS